MDHWWEYVLVALIILGGLTGLGVFTRSKLKMRSGKRPPPGSTGRS